MEEPPIRIFTITPMFAKTLGIKHGPIIITEKTIQHIHENHGQQLEQLGFSPLEYLKIVFCYYNRIYRGTDNSLLFVVYNEQLSKIAAIAMERSETKWIVRTAFPATRRFLKNKTLVYKKKT